MDKPPQNNYLESILYFKKNPNSEFYIQIFICFFWVTFGLVTKGLGLIFIIPFLIYLRNQKKNKYDRIYFTPTVIKLASDKDSISSKFYPISDISLITISYKIGLRRGGRGYFIVDLVLCNGKTKEINFRDFSQIKPSKMNIQAYAIYSYCKKYYNKHIDIIDNTSYFSLTKRI